jgi:hypothetical protein
LIKDFEEKLKIIQRQNILDVGNLERISLLQKKKIKE